MNNLQRFIICRLLFKLFEINFFKQTGSMWNISPFLIHFCVLHTKNSIVMQKVVQIRLCRTSLRFSEVIYEFCLMTRLQCQGQWNFVRFILFGVQIADVFHLFVVLRKSILLYTIRGRYRFNMNSYLAGVNPSDKFK